MELAEVAEELGSTLQSPQWPDDDRERIGAQLPPLELDVEAPR